MATESHDDAATAAAAVCPWCADGGALKLVADGCGNVAVCCTGCGCRGPSTGIAADFEAADAAALAGWNERPAIRPSISDETRERIASAVWLHRLIAPEADDLAQIPVPYAALKECLGAC